MDFLTASIILIATLTALFIINGLVDATIKCWSDVSRKYAKMTPEALETAQIIAEVSQAILDRQAPLEAPEVATEIDPWTAPLNPIERAIATVKAQSTKPEILLLAAPKKLTKTEVNKAKKDQLEAWCQYWNVATGTVTAMRTELKRVAC